MLVAPSIVAQSDPSDAPPDGGQRSHWYANVGVANNLPLAAAFATVPVVVMVIYLLIARRLGATEHI